MTSAAEAIKYGQIFRQYSYQMERCYLTKNVPLRGETLLHRHRTAGFYTFIFHSTSRIRRLQCRSRYPNSMIVESLRAFAEECIGNTMV